MMLILGVAVTACSDAPTVPQPEAVTSVGMQETTAEGHWGYAADNGPQFWGDFGFPTCGEGTSQSPINVVTGDAVPADASYGQSKVRFSYAGPVPVSILNNGHSVQANLDGVRSIEVGGVISTLNQFHFHTQSEHTVNGTPADMEMHFVHTAANGTLTVIGVFIEEGAANRELQKIWNDLPEEEGDGPMLRAFNLMQVLPEGRRSTYRYSGSLTTPGCDEGVNWILMEEPITLSAEQIEDFRAIFSGGEFPEGNRRPTQPLNGRMVSHFR
jgi:carbonic anhydrase